MYLSGGTCPFLARVVHRTGRRNAFWCATPCGCLGSPITNVRRGGARKARVGGGGGDSTGEYFDGKSSPFKKVANFSPFQFFPCRGTPCLALCHLKVPLPRPPLPATLLLTCQQGWIFPKGGETFPCPIFPCRNIPRANPPLYWMQLRHTGRRRPGPCCHRWTQVGCLMGRDCWREARKDTRSVLLLRAL